MRTPARLAALTLATVVAAGCSAPAPVPAPSTPSGSGSGHGQHGSPEPGTAELIPVLLATAAAQDVASATAQGYASTLNTLGCFQDPEAGGMGVHYVKDALMDAEVDGLHPEAFVYELSAGGKIAGLVALEYIVPVDAWTATEPPELFATPFHRHPTLPLWVLHLWLWKDNAGGMFADFNPAVRQCPAGVPIFGRDLPRPAPSTPRGR